MAQRTFTPFSRPRPLVSGYYSFDRPNFNDPSLSALERLRLIDDFGKAETQQLQDYSDTLFVYATRCLLQHRHPAMGEPASINEVLEALRSIPFFQSIQSAIHPSESSLNQAPIPGHDSWVQDDAQVPAQVFDSEAIQMMPAVAEMLRDRHAVKAANLKLDMAKADYLRAEALLAQMDSFEQAWYAELASQESRLQECREILAGPNADPEAKKSAHDFMMEFLTIGPSTSFHERVFERMNRNRPSAEQPAGVS
ncbi:hypothetical protein FS749_011159 [Ceratobasidium sp. UAMH 11750]|nr:hypothetical protein FS749_011159 [Ceratobasidium sp. UAMH 11750]